MSIHKPEECEKIFISWRWAIGVIAGWIIIVASLSYAGGRIISSVQTEQFQMKKDIADLKTTINSKLDLIIKNTEK